MNLPTVTEILSDEGIGFDMSHLPASYSERGTLIHKYMEMKALECDVPEIPNEWRGFADAGDKFWEDMNPYPLLVEPELIHDLLGIVGHLDLLSQNDYWFDLWDYKTGSGVPLYTGPQLMGYKIMIQRMFPQIKPIRRRAVLLEPTGRYKLKPFNDDARDTAIFMEAYHGYMERRGARWTHR